MADTRFVTDGRTDGQTDWAILICLPKFFGGIKSMCSGTPFRTEKIPASSGVMRSLTQRLSQTMIFGTQIYSFAVEVRLG